MSRLRRPSFFLLEGRTEVERDELVFNVDEYSKQWMGLLSGGIAIAQRSAIWDSVVAAY